MKRIRVSPTKCSPGVPRVLRRRVGVIFGGVAHGCIDPDKFVGVAYVKSVLVDLILELRGKIEEADGLSLP